MGARGAGGVVGRRAVAIERNLVATAVIPAALEEVWGFFSDPRNLQRITPPALEFRITMPLPIEMREGAIIDYRLRIRGVPVRWRTRIAAWEPPRRFVDEQVRGPYRRWVHEHRFREVLGGVEAVDRVEYRPPGWVLEPLVHALFVGPDVRRIFAYRGARLREIFPDRGGPVESR